MTLTIYSKNHCPFCDRAKNYLKQNDIGYTEINIEKDTAAREFIVQQGHRTVPQIYFNDELFVAGGWEGLSKLRPDEIKSRLGLNDLGTL